MGWLDWLKFLLLKKKNLVKFKLTHQRVGSRPFSTWRSAFSGRGAFSVQHPFWARERRARSGHTRKYGGAHDAQSGNIDQQRKKIPKCLLSVDIKMDWHCLCYYDHNTTVSAGLDFDRKEPNYKVFVGCRDNQQVKVVMGEFDVCQEDKVTAKPINKTQLNRS